MKNAKLSEQLAVTQYDFDPDATTATEIGWVDFSGYDRMMVSLFRTVGTSNVTLKIMGNTASDGSGTDVDIVTKTVSSQPDAVGDYIFLECSGDDVVAAANGTAIRYLTAVASVATGTDEAVITYILGSARYLTGGLSSDTVA